MGRMDELIISIFRRRPSADVAGPTGGWEEAGSLALDDSFVKTCKQGPIHQRVCVSKESSNSTTVKE